MGHEAREQDLRRLIDERPISKYQWFIFAILFLVNAADGFDAVAIGFVAPALLQEWNLTKAVLGPVMSAALVGLALGAFGAGPLADRVGRKPVLVGAVICFGVFSLLCACATSVTALTALRFLTGIGLGALMPNATTLMSEYAPERTRSLLVNTMMCGFSLGATGGGVLAAFLIPRHGWQSVFVVGGVIPIAFVFALAALPESIRFLVAKGRTGDKLHAILRRIAPDLSLQNVRLVLPEDYASGRHFGLAIVLSRPYRKSSALLWMTYFFALLVYYFITSWLPTMIHDYHYTSRDAALISSLFTLGGGVGVIGAGWLMDRFNAHRVISSGYVLTAGLLYLVGQFSANALWLAPLTFLAGLCMNGALSSCPTLAANTYPTAGRASGVASMLGVGRLGAMLGAATGGTLLQLGLGFDRVFGLLAIPLVLAATAITMKDVFVRSRTANVQIQSR